jgi:hypothetical protein
MALPWRDNATAADGARVHVAPCLTRCPPSGTTSFDQGKVPRLKLGPLLHWSRSTFPPGLPRRPGSGRQPPQQVSRIGQPMLRPLFFRVPGPTTEALNAGNPADDRGEYSAAVTATAATIARLAGIPDPVGHAARVADAFLPDVLSYQPGQPAHFRPAGPDDTHRGDSPGWVANGRALTDDAFGTALHLLTGNPIAASTSRGQPPARTALPGRTRRQRPAGTGRAAARRAWLNWWCPGDAHDQRGGADRGCGHDGSKASQSGQAMTTSWMGRCGGLVEFYAETLIALSNLRHKICPGRAERRLQARARRGTDPAQGRGSAHGPCCTAAAAASV